MARHAQAMRDASAHIAGLAVRHAASHIARTRNAP
jgi:hypothetical protein